MESYTKQLLRINLSSREFKTEIISEEMIRNYIGGRGFAIKILWDEVRQVHPLSEDNKLVFSSGPLTAQPLPSSGKMIVASKSPLTGGYGEGNIGTKAAVHLKKAGYDVMVIEGKFERPCYLSIEDDTVEFLDAQEIWGKNTFQAQDWLEEKHGKNCGILLIGTAGEQLIPYSVIMSQKGRAGGRPGIGAVCGSKNLKAIVLRGNGKIPSFDEEKLKQLGKKGYDEIKKSGNYDFWMRQGTMSMVKYSLDLECLPTFNFRDGINPQSSEFNGDVAEKMRIGRQGCPNCNMQCGTIIEDADGKEVEIDYENVTLLGPNVGISDLKKISVLNRMADEYGLDTISLGNCIGFLMEASEKNVINERLVWGDFEGCKRLVGDIVERRGLGKVICEGVRRASQKLGQESEKWAMHVKGLEISGYDCHAWPIMALSYGTSPIGAHHKDAWTIGWEAKMEEPNYDKSGVETLIEIQRVRSGFFETATVCRFPCGEVAFDFDLYFDFLEAAAGRKIDSKEIIKAGDRIFNLIRAFWIREHQQWDRRMDYVPRRWFDEPLRDGKYKGRKIDKNKYEQLLSRYYEVRGWDNNGIPKEETLKQLGIERF